MRDLLAELQALDAAAPTGDQAAADLERHARRVAADLKGSAQIPRRKMREHADFVLEWATHPIGRPIADALAALCIRVEDFQIFKRTGRVPDDDTREGLRDLAFGGNE